MFKLIFKNIRKVMRNPLVCLKHIKALTKGHIYKLWCRLVHRRVTIGKRFYLNGRITIRGSGTIKIGNNVRIEEKTTKFWTVSKNAVIEIGNRTCLGGTEFSCAEYIKVCDNVLLADARILDLNFHGEKPSSRHQMDTPKPVIIGKGVWIALEAIILKGTEIGENTIVGPKSVVAGAKLLPNKVYMGNPARAVKYISE